MAESVSIYCVKFINIRMKHSYLHSLSLGHAGQEGGVASVNLEAYGGLLSPGMVRQRWAR